MFGFKEIFIYYFYFYLYIFFFSGLPGISAEHLLPAGRAQGSFIHQPRGNLERLKWVPSPGWGFTSALR